METVIDLSIDKLITIYENKVRQRRLDQLAKRLQKTLIFHQRERKKQILLKIRTVWRNKNEAVERLSRADWITMHIFDLQEEGELLSTIFQPFYIEAGEEGQMYALRYLSGKIGRDIIFKGATIWIQNNAIQFGKKYANMISKTTNQAIRNQIAEAIKLGENLNQVMERITKVYQAAEGYRSEMIARTEMGRAYTMSSIKQSKILGIKSWDWLGCNPVCPICGPFMDSNPHTYEEIAAFRMSTHPNCFGYDQPVVPEDFIPNEVY
ncbi:MAG TPA: hypothetical protein ENI52_03955 [Thermoplasmata archaeon]|nr:hypothetical protein [Thermoplasmata archaeon]